ncbi:twin-arginine translocase subunit TatC [Mucilaginibacter lacusdianchii]|uniref:twin-arginine translocase subunit TatC n=1 Tax=Mucilaginibacter lacusdianchii TaxID=2684211 RepID=UPI0018EF2A7D|nr:twin-arginine translocase subunit TatC [Mucilaginibacter sp. JXJ CY 39]
MSENKIVKAIKEKSKDLEVEMSFFDHIEVLRWHLIRSSIAIIIFSCVAYYYYDYIFDHVIMGPTHTSFWTYSTMCKLGEYFHRSGWCIDSLNVKLMNNELAGQFTLQLNSSLLLGLTLGIPYLLFELWRFIKPALHENERKAASGFVVYASGLFILGVLFGYFIITPLSMRFLVGFQVSASIENLYTVDNYLASVATLTLATGIVFQLPIIIYILASLGILTASFMRNTRRYAIVAILVIAAVVTPTPDAITMSVVAIPLFVLYEVGIMVAARIDKRKLKKHDELMRTKS